MKIAYVRVSTEAQSTERQEALAREWGAEKIFIDRAGGKDARPELHNMLAFIREGDVLIVESYSRLARSTKELLNIVETIQSKGASFVSQKESIDTSTPAGRFMLTIFAGLYQFEIEMMKERQAEGIAEAKKAGKYKGRKPIDVDPSLFISLYKEWKAGKISGVAFARRLHLKSNTFYRRIKAFEGRE